MRFPLPTEQCRKSLATKRLLLEPLTEAHAARLFEQLCDASIYTYFPNEPPSSVDDLKTRFARLSKRTSPDRKELWLNWALKPRESDGYVGTFQATIRPDAPALIAYIVFSRFQRSGFAREAAEAVLQFLFEDVGVSSVEAKIDTRNVASIALVNRLGFTLTSTVVDADYFKGSSSDEFRYSCDAAQFRSQRQSTLASESMRQSFNDSRNPSPFADTN